MSTKIPLITTADQLLVASEDLGSCELVRGRLIMRPYMGTYEAHITGNLLKLIQGMSGFLLLIVMGCGIMGDRIGYRYQFSCQINQTV